MGGFSQGASPNKFMPVSSIPPLHWVLPSLHPFRTYNSLLRLWGTWLPFSTTHLFIYLILVQKTVSELQTLCCRYEDGGGKKGLLTTAHCLFRVCLYPEDIVQTLGSKVTLLFFSFSSFNVVMLVIWNKVQFICFVSIPPLILLVFVVYILSVWNLKHGSMSQKRTLRRGPQSLYPHPYPHAELTSHLFNLWFIHFCAFLPQSVFCFLFFPTLKVISQIQ